MYRKILTGLFWVLGLVLLLWWTRSPSTTLKVGDVVPAIYLKDFSGKVMLLNFWATWCPPCVEEMPQLEALSQHFKDKNFILVGMNEEGRPIAQARETVGSFRRKVPLNFPIIFDDKETAAETFGVTSLPVSFLIDSTGHIVDVISGSVRWMSPKYLQKIESLL